MLTIFLLLTLFIFFYTVTGGEMPEVNLSQVRSYVSRFAIPSGSAAGVFILSSIVFGTPLAGLAWGFLGWFLPQWIQHALQAGKQARLRAMAKDFIVSSAGLFSAGQVTPEVISTMAGRFPDPFGAELNEMLVRRKANPHAFFPKMFDSLGEKYEFSEFKATAAILAASERAGGPRAAAGGLKRFGLALRQRDRLYTERQKSLIEVKIAGIVVILLLVAGLLLDVTSFRNMFMEPSGKVVLGISSAITVGLIFMTKKISQSSDLV